MTGVIEAAVVALLLAFAAVKLLRRASRPAPAPSSLSEPVLAAPPPTHAPREVTAPQPATRRPPAEALPSAPVVAARGRPRRLRRIFVEMAVLGPPRGLSPWRAGF